VAPAPAPKSRPIPTPQFVTPKPKPVPQYAAPAQTFETVQPSTLSRQRGSDGEPPEPVEPKTPEPAPEKGISLISEATFIQGDIVTDDHIEVRGSVSGDIRSKGNVAVQGVIMGNIKGDKIGLSSCKIKGDISAGTGIVEDAGSVVIGDVRATNIVLDGKLKGNISADNVVVLRSNAYYIGNVVAGSIAIENGAVVRGSITTLIEGDPEAPFEAV